MLRPSLSTFLLPVMACQLIVVMAAPPVHADSWQLTMQTGDAVNVWLVDEKLGVKMQMPNKPELEIILRVDLQQTIWSHPQSGRYAMQPWGQGAAQGGTPIVDPRAAAAIERSDQATKKLDPRARAAARRNLAKRYGRLTDGQTGRPNLQYVRTGMSKPIGKYTTYEVVESMGGTAAIRPTGRQFWVADYPGWEKLATALQQAVDNFAALSPEQRIPFKELGGMAMEMTDSNGVTSQVLEIRSAPIAPIMMQPAPQSQQVPLPVLMQQP